MSRYKRADDLIPGDTISYRGGTWTVRDGFGEPSPPFSYALILDGPEGQREKRSCHAFSTFLVAEAFAP